MGGLLAIAAAIFLTRRCLTRHRSRPEAGFVIDRSAADEVVPFVEQGGAAGAGVLSEKGRATGSSHAMLSGVGQSEAIEAADTASGVATAGTAGPSSRRAVHEEDAEDAAVDVLPPMYKETWAARRTNAELQDGVAGVSRVEQGRRAQDNAPPSFPPDRKA